MDYTQFAQYVEDAEQQANKNFNSYKTKLRLFALLGYLVIIGMILAFTFLVGGLTALAFISPAILFFLVKKKLIFVLIPMIWIMARSLWVKIEEPKGYELTRDRFPNLFTELDALSKELDSLKVHTVLLTAEMNAAVVQTPRLGILGWHKNTLFLGLELMLALTPEQVRGVVAHELGHLSGNHSKFNGWIYRIRETWARLMNGMMAQDNLGARMMAKFFGWYSPRFSAFSFPLARNNEYEADAMAAELTSPQAIGDALINVHVVAPYLEEHYWQTYFKKADGQPTPEVMPWAGLNEFLRTNSDPKLQERLDQALSIKTDISDTHPSLNDRLTALKVKAELPVSSKDNAAHAWLGDQHDSVISEFDTDWFAHNEQPWKERYEYVKTSAAKLAEIENTDLADLSDDQLWELGQLEAEFGEIKKATKMIEAFKERNPDSVGATYLQGCYLMTDKNEQCLDFFEQVLSSPDYAYNASANAYQFLMDANRPEEAELWRQKAEGASQVLAEAEAERENLFPKDPLIKADLSDQTVLAVIAKLKQSKKIKKAWIAQKKVKHYQDIPAIAVAVIGKGFALSEDTFQKTLAEEFSEFTMWIIPKAGDYKPLAKSIIKAGDRVV